MNLTINSFITFIIKIFKIFVFIFLLNTIFFIYLPKQTVNNELYDDNDSPFYQINIENSFEEKKEIKKTKTITKSVEKINSFILIAVYSLGNLDGWVVLSGKSKNSDTTILAKNEKYLGYRLKEIYKEKVIFEKNGQYFELYLNKDNNLKKILQTINEDIDYTKPLKVSNENIKKYIKDFDSIWKSIAIKETKDENKQINGFKILSIVKNSPFDKLGLKKGDIIKKVNNIVLKSYADAFKIYNKIGKVENLQITILRKNEEMEINYEID